MRITWRGTSIHIWKYNLSPGAWYSSPGSRNSSWSRRGTPQYPPSRSQWPWTAVPPGNIKMWTRLYRMHARFYSVLRSRSRFFGQSKLRAGDALRRLRLHLLDKQEFRTIYKDKYYPKKKCTGMAPGPPGAAFFLLEPEPTQVGRSRSRLRGIGLPESPTNEAALQHWFNFYHRI